MCIWHYQEAKMGVADKFQSVISLKLFGVESWNFEISLLTPSGFFRNFFNKIWGGHPGGIVWVGMEWPYIEHNPQIGHGATVILEQNCLVWGCRLLSIYHSSYIHVGYTCIVQVSDLLNFRNSKIMVHVNASQDHIFGECTVQHFYCGRLLWKDSYFKKILSIRSNTVSTAQICARRAFEQGPNFAITSPNQKIGWSFGTPIES